jgi:hypothetical protein
METTLQVQVPPAQVQDLAPSAAGDQISKHQDAQMSSEAGGAAAGPEIELQDLIRLVRLGRRGDSARA